MVITRRRYGRWISLDVVHTLASSAAAIAKALAS